MRVAVIKFCRGYNRKIEDWDYSDGDPIIVDEDTRGPTGWHSYAAATNGFVMLYEGLEVDYEKINDADYDIAILCVDNWIEPISHVAELISLREQPTKIYLGLHEGMYNLQILNYMFGNQRGYLSCLKDLTLLDEVSGWIINTPPDYYAFWRCFENFCGQDIGLNYIPYTWDMSLADKFIRPIEEREGIMIGGMPLDPRIPRNTFSDLVVAANVSNDLGTPVTWMSSDSDCGNLQFAIKDMRNLFNDPNLLTIVKPMRYREWLHCLAKHRVYLNMDMSSVQGQAVGDCVFLDLPCVGGNSAIQQMCCPSEFLMAKHFDIIGDYWDLERTGRWIKKLFIDDETYKYFIECANKIHIDFPTVINELEELC